MGRIQDSFLARATSVLCALALILLTSAHRPVPAGPDASDPGIAAYLSSGGTLADLCLSGGADDDHAGHADCPACTLAAAMALPPVALGPAAPVLWRSAAAPLPRSLSSSGHGPRAPPARGPPAVQLI